MEKNAVSLKVVTHRTCGRHFIINFVVCLPPSCPNCSESLNECDINISNFPKPFTSGCEFAIVLKPTRGTFSTYSLGSELHIGIFDPNSAVYSFVETGVHAEPSSSWRESIAIMTFDSAEVDMSRLLRDFLAYSSARFVPQKYDLNHWNCFNFVVEFTNFLGAFPNMNKQEFAKRFIRAPLRRVLRYHRLLHEVTLYQEFVMPL
ncbi:hypothetical protein AB6A40_005781 [Gnathostoma spinigerum]|uniref:MKRN2 opposite strand protein-like C-terminal domain-containing protein n=1 Tax=Gnathostoma spinigerum TaxID=75299 RepID=A0ABD6ER87_9BILA